MVAGGGAAGIGGCGGEWSRKGAVDGGREVEEKDSARRAGGEEDGEEGVD